MFVFIAAMRIHIQLVIFIAIIMRAVMEKRLRTYRLPSFHHRWSDGLMAWMLEDWVGWRR